MVEKNSNVNSFWDKFGANSFWWKNSMVEKNVVENSMVENTMGEFILVQNSMVEFTLVQIPVVENYSVEFHVGAKWLWWKIAWW